MDDKSLYAAILGLMAPWGVEKVDLQLTDGEVHVWVALPKDTLWVCPECLASAPIHDHRERQWRHLDTCQYRTVLHARVPRRRCPTHGLRQLRVPWAEENARFTALFEALAIDWMKHAAISTVAEQLRLSWDEAAAIQARAVRRGLARRGEQPARHVGIDETSFARRHQYVTVVTDLERSRVLYVADDRRQESLDAFWPQRSPAELAAIEAVAMDMWPPYFDSTLAHLPDAATKIVFDKFHIAQHATQAVDKIRRQEHRALHADGYDWLSGTKFTWLRHPAKFTLTAWRDFLGFLRQTTLKTGRAWALKEMLMTLWDYVYPKNAEKHFEGWYAWAIRSRLEPIKRVARMLKSHWPNIKTFFTHRITNAGAESMNSKIQKIKVLARGFRNRDRFKMAIYFHLGGLDLYPTPLAARP
jgi:transposase